MLIVQPGESSNCEVLPRSAKSLEAGGMPAATGVASARQARDGERRHLRVLFSDLVNSTEIAF